MHAMQNCEDFWYTIMSLITGVLKGAELQGGVVAHKSGNIHRRCETGKDYLTPRKYGSLVHA